MAYGWMASSPVGAWSDGWMRKADVAGGDLKLWRLRAVHPPSPSPGPVYPTFESRQQPPPVQRARRQHEQDAGRRRSPVGDAGRQLAPARQRDAQGDPHEDQQDNTRDRQHKDDEGADRRAVDGRDLHFQCWPGAAGAPPAARRSRTPTEPRLWLRLGRQLAIYTIYGALRHDLKVSRTSRAAPTTIACFARDHGPAPARSSTKNTSG